MSLKKWNGKKLAVAGLGGGVLLAALALTWSDQDHKALAAGKEGELSLAIAGEDQEEQTTPEAQDAEEDGGLSLSLADGLDADETEETEEAKETEEETETEAPVSYETLETTATGSDGIIAMDISGVVDNCMPSIVSITQKSVQEIESYFYGVQEYEQEGAGSGIIIAQNDTELLIATNRHVVAGATEIHVCFTADAEDPEDLIVPAVTKGMDSQYDLAVVAVELKDIPEEILGQLKIATLGSSKNLKVGETAIAIGNALGIGQTVTSGIISALEREVTTDAGTFTELQTDAAINFGCSGGALLNARGEVIGINSAKATGDYAESMGYAIPIDAAIPVLTNLINRETRQVVEDHGFLGITVVSVSNEAKELYGMPVGAVVNEVNKGSAAEKAGLKKGDIITKFDGISITTKEELVDTLEYYAVGETVTMEVQRASDGTYDAKEIEVTLQKGETDTAKVDTKDSSKDPSSENGRSGDQDEKQQVPEFLENFPEFYGEFFDDGQGRDGQGLY